MVHGVTRLNNNGQSSGGRLRVFSSYPRSGTMVLLTVEIDSLRIEVLYGPNLTEEEHARIPQEENLFIKGTRSDSRIVDEIRRFHFLRRPEGAKSVLWPSYWFWADCCRFDWYFSPPPGGQGIHLDFRNFSPMLCPVHNEGHGTGSINSISRFLVYTLWRDYGQDLGLAPSRGWPYRLDPE
jgi:hypothetical protein